MREVTLKHLDSYLTELLDAARFKDYCPNGLQVEGRARVARMVTGVTASQALLDAAVSRGADAILVHHGYFWRGEDSRVTGIRKRRLATLLEHDVSLFAYHLPLDAHQALGNNAQMAAAFGWTVDARFGDQDIGCVGRVETTMRLDALADRMSTVLRRAPMAIGDPGRSVTRVAWCSGGAQSWFEQAIALGVDCYVSGEISEQTVHLANEAGVAYIAAGHHATERFGVRALGDWLRSALQIEVEFIDIDNPV